MDVLSITTDQAIERFRRHLAMGTALRAALLVAVTAALIGPWLSGRAAGAALLVAAGAAWILLTQRALRVSQLASEGSQLIASGQLDLAEQRLDAAVRRFSIHRAVKFMSLHHLAVLRHAQRRWSESADLCRALLRQRLREGDGLGRSARLLLSEALLEMDDLPGAHAAIAGLYQARLPLGEAVHLLRVQTDYEARIGASASMLRGVGPKVALAELMDATSSARTQALLARAAQREGRSDLSAWLRDRAALLESPARLVYWREDLQGLWSGRAEA